jgi:hypothetical protein
MSSVTLTDRSPASAAGEAVTSPDQHKPGHRRLDYAGAVISAAILLLLLLGDHPNATETAWVSGSAAVLLAALIADWRLRRVGARRD